MKTENKFLEKASQQALAEVLGYDEARAYYLLLTKQEKELEKEFSYSKKYRLMKSLFDLGAMAKIKQEDKDFFSYILLPPTFLYSEKVDKEIIEYLEKIYLENFKEIFDQNFSQIILKDEKILLIFLLKYFMKDEARLIVDEFDKEILGKESSKIRVTKGKEKKSVGIIDRNFVFEFSGIRVKREYEYIGYLANSEYISVVEKEMEGVC